MAVTPVLLSRCCREINTPIGGDLFIFGGKAKLDQPELLGRRAQGRSRGGDTGERKLTDHARGGESKLLRCGGEKAGLGEKGRCWSGPRPASWAGPLREPCKYFCLHGEKREGGLGGRLGCARSRWDNTGLGS